MARPRHAPYLSRTAPDFQTSGLHTVPGLLPANKSTMLAADISLIAFAASGTSALTASGTPALTASGVRAGTASPSGPSDSAAAVAWAAGLAAELSLRLDDTAQDHRKDVVDVERGVDRRKDLLENEQLGILLRVLVALGFEHGNARTKALDLQKEFGRNGGVCRL